MGPRRLALLPAAGAAPGNRRGRADDAPMDAYEHQRALGKGAMGSVALVRRKADGELLALKSMAVHSAKDRALARNEIEILRKLSHPHVVRFEDTFVLGQDVCIVMQFCEGGDLARLIGEQRSAGRKLPEAEVRGVLGGVLVRDRGRVESRALAQGASLHLCGCLKRIGSKRQR